MDLLAVQGTLKSPLQCHSSKASILWCSAFFIVQLSHPHTTFGKTIALTRWTFFCKVISLIFNMLSSLVIDLLPKSKHRHWIGYWERAVPGLVGSVEGCWQSPVLVQPHLGQILTGRPRKHDHLEFSFVGFQEGGQVGTWSDHQAAAPLSCLLEVLPCQTPEWRFSLLNSRVPLVLRNGISRGRRLLEFACQITWGRERLEFRRRLTPGPS